MLASSNPFVAQPRASFRPARASVRVYAVNKGEQLSKEAHHATATAFLAGFAVAQGFILTPGAALADQAAEAASPPAPVQVLNAASPSEASSQSELLSAPGILRDGADVGSRAATVQTINTDAAFSDGNQKAASSTGGSLSAQPIAETADAVNPVGQAEAKTPQPDASSEKQTGAVKPASSQPQVQLARDGQPMSTTQAVLTQPAGNSVSGVEPDEVGDTAVVTQVAATESESNVGAEVNKLATATKQAPQPSIDLLAESKTAADMKNTVAEDGKKTAAPQPAVGDVAEAVLDSDEKKAAGDADSKKAVQPAVGNVAEAAPGGDEKKAAGSSDSKKPVQPAVGNVAEAAPGSDEKKAAGSADSKKPVQPAVGNVAEAAPGSDEKKAAGSAERTKAAAPQPAVDNVAESIEPAVQPVEPQSEAAEAPIPTPAASPASAPSPTIAAEPSAPLQPPPAGKPALKSSIDYMNAAERVVSEIEREVRELEALLGDDPDALDVMQSIESDVLLLESRLEKVGPREPLEVAQEVEMELEVVEAETALLSVEDDLPKGPQSSLTVAAKGIQAQLSAIMAILSGL